jgi:peptide-methionine (S)-S-oxide reductase
MNANISTLKLFSLPLWLCVAWLSVAIWMPVPSAAQDTKQSTTEKQKSIAVFGGGCFWCQEAVFERVWGVDAVISGYSGGTLPNPSYEQVLTDQTGHAEVIQIQYDPSIVSYEELLRIFFKSHDPTSLNAQGPDFGTRYRSVVFYKTKEEKEAIDGVLEEFRKKRTFRGKIVTEISSLKIFYPAEEYHQDYFAKHPEKPYCEINIRPKIGKFEKGFKDNSKVQKAKQEKSQTPKK